MRERKSCLEKSGSNPLFLPRKSKVVVVSSLAPCRLPGEWTRQQRDTNLTGPSSHGLDSNAFILLSGLVEISLAFRQNKVNTCTQQPVVTLETVKFYL